MRICAGFLLCGLLLAGCATKPAPPPGSRLLVTPETALLGSVVKVIDDARYAVLKFPVGAMPSRDQRLGVFRKGLKVGEVKISGPQMDEITAGDIINGEVQVGDEVRGE